VATAVAFGSLVAFAAFAIGTYVTRASDPGSVAARGGRNAELVRSAEAAVGLEPMADALSELGEGAFGVVAAGLYSAGYWPFLLLALLVTLRRDRARFHRLWFAVAVSGLVGLAIMALFPVAPPRLDGADDVVAAHGLDGIAHPRGLVNPYAAMPSFHVGWSVVAACAIATVAPRARWWVWLQPVAMTVAVVATANHYLLDVVVGVALGLGVWWATATPWCRTFLPRPATQADQGSDGDRGGTLLADGNHRSGRDHHRTSLGGGGGAG
jgi:hypothetical protein